MNRKLTKEQMQAAHFARQVALDPNPVPTTGDPREDRRVNRQIALGRRVLGKYTLTYSPRFTVGAPKAPSDAAGVLKVPSGYIATNEAYRLAIFRKRTR